MVGLALHLVECMPAMSVAGSSTDAKHQPWVSARAAAPKSPATDDAHAAVVFALESSTAPATGALDVNVKLVDDAHALATNEIRTSILVSH